MRAKILIVDDSKTVRVIVKNAFRQFDCDLLEAGDGAEALATVTRYPPDLILLDVTMPVMDGTEVFRRLKADPTLRHIPVILLVTEGDRRKALQSATVFCSDHVLKPLDGTAIAEKVRRLLDLRPTRTPSRAAPPAESAAHVHELVPIG